MERLKASIAAALAVGTLYMGIVENLTKVCEKCEQEFVQAVEEALDYVDELKQ